MTTSGVFPNALGEVSSGLLAPRMVSGRSRLLATIAYVDGSFEANSPRIRSHLAHATDHLLLTLWRDLIAISPALSASRLVFQERHAFRMRRVYIFDIYEMIKGVYVDA